MKYFKINFVIMIATALNCTGVDAFQVTEVPQKKVSIPTHILLNGPWDISCDSQNEIMFEPDRSKKTAYVHVDVRDLGIIHNEGYIPLKKWNIELYLYHKGKDDLKIVVPQSRFIETATPCSNAHRAIFSGRQLVAFSGVIYSTLYLPSPFNTEELGKLRTVRFGMKRTKPVFVRCQLIIRN